MLYEIGNVKIRLPPYDMQEGKEVLISLKNISEFYRKEREKPKAERIITEEPQIMIEKGRSEGKKYIEQTVFGSVSEGLIFRKLQLKMGLIKSNYYCEHCSSLSADFQKMSKDFENFIRYLDCYEKKLRPAIDSILEQL